jgi:CrcB protein
MTPLLIAIGGGIGALARFAIATAIPKSKGGFPFGITIVNVVGSIMVGYVVGRVVSEPFSVPFDAVTIGLLGGFTTFSTWMVDIDEASNAWTRVRTIGVPLLAGVTGAWLGVLVGLS